MNFDVLNSYTLSRLRCCSEVVWKFARRTLLQRLTFNDERRNVLAKRPKTQGKVSLAAYLCQSKEFGISPTFNWRQEERPRIVLPTCATETFQFYGVRDEKACNRDKIFARRLDRRWWESLQLHERVIVPFFPGLFVARASQRERTQSLFIRPLTGTRRRRAGEWRMASIVVRGTPFCRRFGTKHLRPRRVPFNPICLPLRSSSVVWKCDSGSCQIEVNILVASGKGVELNSRGNSRR